MSKNKTVPAEFNNDKNAMGALETINNYDGVLDMKGMKPYLVNMGGKPYISKGGLSLKLQSVANKRGGIKTILSIPVSYSHEGPEDMQKFLNLPPQLLDKMLKDRDYDMAALTTPKGTALNKCIIVFGDGLKVSETATANPQNIKMKTIHEFLDVMAATRAYNRCVKKITADGFMDANMIDEENFNYMEDDFQIDADGELPFPITNGGNNEDQVLGNQEESTQERTGGGDEELSKAHTHRTDDEAVGPDVQESGESKMICSECSKKIKEVVSTYSKSRFGKELCLDCQKKYK
ncbi:hypothetical protein [Tepidibacter hydrothermalis]|uniref:Uncharacterized protein n=1 Tax=Tepidibacter hydrothermalis TaxID=3036126 RepID=A0ABY8E769_9FIRM|nr:hypothetical protein [Tepidibacter hydrothermalis]WFD08741.1 hypothetical protein P4S50_10060 [Tepidibacter hydrothermalis]